MYDERKRVPAYQGAIDAGTVGGLASDAVFDTKAGNAVIATANSNEVPLSHPRSVIWENRNATIPEARLRRILRELHAAAAVQDTAAVGRDPEGGEVSLYDASIRIYPHRGNLDQWRVFMRGPDDTWYAHPDDHPRADPHLEKWWAIYVTFPPTYPIRPPIVRFVSVPYHMNVSTDGRVCLNLIEKGYMATMSVVELLQNIKQLFIEPDLNTPVDLMKRDLYKINQAKYELRARKSTMREARDSPEAWLGNRFIVTDSPADFTVEVTEGHVPQYMRSQMSGRYVPVRVRVIDESGVMMSREEHERLRHQRARAARDQPTDTRRGRPYVNSTLEFLGLNNSTP
jgi:ubiquitin-protein ligase